MINKNIKKTAKIDKIFRIFLLLSFVSDHLSE